MKTPSRRSSTPTSHGHQADRLCSARSLRPSRSPRALSTASDRFGHPSCGRHGVLVFPEAQHGPSIRFERVSRRSIPMTIGREFLRPVTPIRGGQRPMDRTAVPEASVHEHGDSARWEHDVGSYWPPVRRPDRVIDPETKPCTVKRGSQRALRTAVPAAIGAHDLPTQLRNVGPRSIRCRGFTHPPLPTLGS
jgi:hypothetical protein